MVGIIAQIFCALSLLASGALQVTDERAFILGAVYPNLQKADPSKGPLLQLRSQSDNRWLEIIAAPSDFKKGILVNHLVQDLHTARMADSYRTSTPHLPLLKEQIVSYFEDSILYDKINNWPKIVSYFDTIHPEEQAYDKLSEFTLLEWHRFVKTYCAQRPSALSTHTLFNQFPILRSRVPIGLPSLASKAYVAVAFKRLKKKSYPQKMLDFYHNLPKIAAQA